MDLLQKGIRTPNFAASPRIEKLLYQMLYQSVEHIFHDRVLILSTGIHAVQLL